MLSARSRIEFVTDISNSEKEARVAQAKARTDAAAARVVAAKEQTAQAQAATKQAARRAVKKVTPAFFVAAGMVAVMVVAESDAVRGATLALLALLALLANAN